MNTMLNTLNPTYQLPYGCGTIAVVNALIWKDLPTDFKKIQHFLQEQNFTSISTNLTKTLEKLELSFTYQDEINIPECLAALDKKKGVILLSWANEKNPVGHYSFFYRNRFNQMLENDKLSAPVLFKSLASKKSPKSGKKALAWIID